MEWVERITSRKFLMTLGFGVVLAVNAAWWPLVVVCGLYVGAEAATDILAGPGGEEE